MSNQCNSSSDCAAAFGDGVVRFCYERSAFSSEVFFCDCSPWYGWQGRKCDEESFQLYWYRFVLFVMITASLVSILTLSKVLLNLGNLMLRARGAGFRNLSSKERPYFLATLSFLIAAFSFLIHAAGQLPSLFDSRRFEVVSYNYPPDFEDLTVVGGKGLSYVLFLGPTVQLYGILLIVLTWFDILKQSSKFFPDAFGMREKFLEKFLVLSCFTYLPLALILVILDLVFLIMVLVGTTAIVNGSLFVYATNRFLFILSEFISISTNKEIFERIRMAYKVTAWATAVSAFSIFAFFAISLFQYEILRIGGFNYVLLCRDISVLSGISLTVYMGFFLLKASNNLSSKMMTPTRMAN